MVNPYDDLTPEGEKMAEEKPKAKGIFESKTVWFNLITTGVAVLTYFVDSDILADKPEIVASIGMVIGVANIILRLITDKPVTIK